MNRIGPLTGLLALLTVVPSVGLAQTRSSGAWENDIMLYGIGAQIDGDARFERFEAPVDVSFGDILDNLEMGFMGAYRGGTEDFSLVVDAIYLDLGKSSDEGLVRRAEFAELVLDFTGGYRLSSGVEFFGGLRVTDLSTKVGLLDQLGVEIEASDTFYDPILGVRFVRPLSESGRWLLQARGDIGGFGASMDLTWQAMGHVGFKATEWFSIWGGYRALGQDFKDSGESGKSSMDVVCHGPVFGVGFHF